MLNIPLKAGLLCLASMGLWPVYQYHLVLCLELKRSLWKSCRKVKGCRHPGPYPATTPECTRDSIPPAGNGLGA